MSRTVRMAAPAKINLRLCILAREASGFHSLETLFCALSLADEVEVGEHDGPLALYTSGEIDMGPPERNLAVRAAERFHSALGREARVAIRLRKRLPAAAGLGGGSSDAAATLRALNTLHGETFSRDVLLQIASELGSDVPFFLCGSPFALAWGRGERLLALPPLPPRPVLIAHPRVAMPTAAAFRGLADRRGPDYHTPPTAFEPGAFSTWEGVCGLAVNDFEPIADLQVPPLATARAAMQAAGAELAMLSGSGAALFGVFRTAAERDRAGRELRGSGFDTWSAETLQTTPQPQVDRLVDFG